MKIDFNKIECQKIDNFKSGEKYILAHMYVDELNRIMHATLVPGASIGVHQHTDNSEVIFILSGVGTVICDGKEETIMPGECHYCPKGSTHTLINRGDSDLVFNAVVPNQ